MRDIKFRAWDGNVMHSVDTLEFPQGGTRWYGCGTGKGVSEANPVFDWNVNSQLMQYTGLKDKNGVEIYEGDIVEGRYVNSTAKLTRKYIIEWDDKLGGYPKLPLVKGTMEIIGNIHENPELIQN